MKQFDADREDEMNPRSCIVTGEKADRDQLLRFVLAPEANVIVDLKENLPGRGVWTLARKDIVAKAVDKGLFAKEFKQQVLANRDLPELTQKLISERALNALAMAKKSGVIITGFAKVDKVVRSGKACLLLHASDASGDGKRKLASAVAFVDHMGADAVEVFEPFTIGQLSNALGLENAVHVAAIEGGATKNLLVAIRRMNAYIDISK